MLKKIIIMGVVATIILVIIGMFLSPRLFIWTDDFPEPEFIEADIIIPTKASRPGCEENNGCYIPSVLVIEPGTNVTWKNEDSAFHSITAGFYDAPTENGFDSGHLDPYESYDLLFVTPTTVNYFCTLHPWMQGQVIVE